MVTDVFYRAMHTNLLGHMNVIDEQLRNKTHALNVDQKCLQYRVQLEDPDRSQ